MRGRCQEQCKKTLQTENFCSQCDNVLHAEFDANSFWNYEVGRVRCEECGTITLPCNECFGTDAHEKSECNECPWKNASVVDELEGVCS